MKNEESENSGLEFIKGLFDEFYEKYPRPKENGDAEEGGVVEIRFVKKRILTRDNQINRDESPSDEEKNEHQPPTDEDR